MAQQIRAWKSKSGRIFLTRQEAMQDFDPKDAVKYRRLYENDELYSEDDLYD